MKKLSLKSLAVALAFGIFAILGTANSTFAQSGNPVTFEIPFEFQANGETFSAGKYSVKKISSEIFLLSSENSDEKLLVRGIGSLPYENAVGSEKLIFNKYGERHFLREVYAKRGAFGFMLNESKTEKKIRQGSTDENEKLARIAVNSK
jgi:hypothetical protein